MASIGVKYKSGTAGTDLAAVLAKALLGDPKDEMQMARLRSLLMTDELTREHLRINTLLAQGKISHEAAAEARLALKERERIAAAKEWSGVGQRVQSGSSPGDRPAVAAPAPAVAAPPAAVRPAPLPLALDPVTGPAEEPVMIEPEQPAPALPVPAISQPFEPLVSDLPLPGMALTAEAPVAVEPQPWSPTPPTEFNAILDQALGPREEPQALAPTPPPQFTDILDQSLPTAIPTPAVAASAPAPLPAAVPVAAAPTAAPPWTPTPPAQFADILDEALPVEVQAAPAVDTSTLTVADPTATPPAIVGDTTPATTGSTTPIRGAPPVMDTGALSHGDWLTQLLAMNESPVEQPTVMGDGIAVPSAVPNPPPAPSLPAVPPALPENEYPPATPILPVAPEANEYPVPVEPPLPAVDPDRMLRPVDPEITGSIGPRPPAPPLPQAAPGAMQPVPGPGRVVSAPLPPLPPIPDAAPPSAAAGGPPTAAPAPSGGPSETVQTKFGALSREQVETLMLNASHKGVDEMARVAGFLGLAYNPQSKLTSDQLSATFASGGTLPGRESVVGGDEAIRVAQASKSGKEHIQVIDNVPYTVVTGKDGAVSLTPTPGFATTVEKGSRWSGPGESKGKALNVLADVGGKIERNEPLNETDIRDVTIANNTLREMRQVTGKDEQGRAIVNFVQEPPPEGMLTPEKARAYAGRTGTPAPATPATPAPAAVAGPGAPTGGTPPPRPEGEAKIGEVVQGPGGTFQMRTSDTVESTVSSEMTYQRLFQARNAYDYFRHRDIKDIPKAVTIALNDPTNATLVQAAYADPDAREYLNHAKAMQDVGVHSTTGASSTPLEAANMIAQAVPRPGDDERNYKSKLSNITNLLRGQRLSIEGQFNLKALKALDASYRESGYDLLTGKEVPTASAPASAPATSTAPAVEIKRPPDVDPKLWARMTPEQKALWQ